MAVANVLLLIQITGYVIGLILSLCIVAPMSQQQSDFEGNCLLFSQGTWDEEAKRMNVVWALKAYCHYVLLVGGIILTVSCIQIYRLLMLWLDGRDTSFLATFLEAAGCTVLCGLIVSVAIIITLGFLTWCQSVSQWFPSCEDLAGHTIDNIDMHWTETFYVEIEIVQVGTWGAFTTFVGLAVAATLKLLHAHNVQNVHAVASRERAHERTPLLNSGWPEDGTAALPAAEA